jgi:hypothetical protein
MIKQVTIMNKSHTESHCMFTERYCLSMDYEHNLMWVYIMQSRSMLDSHCPLVVTMLTGVA